MCKLNSLITKVRIIARHIVDYRLRCILRKSKQVYIGKGVAGWKTVNFKGNNSVGNFANFSSPIKVGFGSTIGPYNVISGPVEIGPFCQLGQFIGIFGKDHPMSYLTTYINRYLFNGELKENVVNSLIKIGAGVWIGQGAIITKGTNIGDGAIIGAGAIVTKDIPAYSIAAGNPARIIRYRFSPEVISLLQQFHWWDLSPEELSRFKPLFFIDFLKNESIGIELLQKSIEEINRLKNG